MRRDPDVPETPDADLVAYLDGELSPADSVRIGQRLASEPTLAARLDHLMKGGRPFRSAFDPLLVEAPSGRLDTMLAKVLARPEASPRRTISTRGRWAALIAAGIALMIAGAGFDRLVATSSSPARLASVQEGEASEDWRGAVAQYLSFYTTETLSGSHETAEGRRAELAVVGSKLGLSLTPADVELPDLALKRADLYDYDGKPLGFLAYLDPANGPLALCITEGQGSGTRVERQNDMNTVSWSKGRHVFMLIGRAKPDRLQAIAKMVEARFAAAPNEPG